MGSDNKSHIKMAVLGHIDSEKSTTAGHMMLEFGAVDEDTMDDLEDEASNAGWESSKYAWIFDKLENERESGDTIDVSLGKFETDNHVVTLIGADAVLLVVSAVEEEFDAGVKRDGVGQMREHIQMAYAFGVKQMIVAVTKMDVCGWSERRYNEIVKGTKTILGRLGYNSDKVPFVPISGLDGDNISEARDSADSSWYHGWEKYVNGITEYPGKTLLEAIDDMHLPGQKPTGSFRLPIRNVYHIPGAGTVVTGTVVAGSCWPGMYVTLAPNNIPAQVQSIQQHHESLDECSTGDIVGLSLGYTDSDGDNLYVRRGEVVADSDNPASNCSSFTAQIIVTSHPGYIKSGYTPSVHCGTGRALCRFEVLDTMDVRTGRRIGRKEVKIGMAAMVKMTPYKPFCVETLSDYPALGRIVVRDLGRTVAVGSVKSVQKC